MINLVQQYFSMSAKKYPNKLALCCDSDSISYLDADLFSNAFARKLISLGVLRGSFIPFFMLKSVNSILSILSILKADCAYVPVDVHSPAQRLLSILKATKAPVLIVDKESKTLVQALLAPNELPLLIDISDYEPEDMSPIQYRNLSIDIAYVLFTSGSTGVPKGVMIPHKAIIDYIDWCVCEYDLTDQDVISNHAPLYFDNSTFDIYTAFKTGASLHLVHESLNLVLPRLIKWLDERQITTFFCVPSVMVMLLKSRRLKEDSFKSLRHVICAGEVLPPDTLREWMKKYPNIQFTNMYGPTEITVDCSYHVIQSIPDESELSIPIGKARQNMELFIRLENGELSQNAGDKGELLVRGTSVAYGYLGDTEKTEKVFIQNPKHNLFHDPLYCTGDLVSIKENGDFVFLGRADDQIKFLGYRIELGEIESILVSIDFVIEGVVVFGKRSSEGDDEIGAFVHLKDGKELRHLREALSEKLPSYMIPTKIELAENEFPRTPNGKYDRKAIKRSLFEA